MPQPALRDDRRDQFVAGEDRAVECLADRPAQQLVLLRGHAEVALPARPLPGSSGGDQREEGSPLLGCEQVERAPHRPGLDQAPLGQGAADLAGPRRLAPDPDRELGGRRHLRLDTAETTDHARNGQATDRIEQVPLHPPCKRLLPGDPHRHAPSVTRALPSVAGDACGSKPVCLTYSYMGI